MAEVVALKVKEKISVSEKLDSLDALQAMMLQCTGQQKDILFFIWKRVTGWGHKVEHIRPSHFIDGVYDTNTGERILCGLGIDARDLRRHITALIKKGLINRELRFQHGSANWPYYSINFDIGFNMLKQPKPKAAKEKSGLKIPKKGAAGDFPPEGEGEFTPLTKPEIYKTRKTNHAGRSPAEGVSDSAKEKAQDAITRSKQKSKAAADKKLARAARWETADGLKELWAAECKAVFPDYKFDGWTSKEFSMAVKLKDKWARDNDGEKVAPFLTWAVRNWSRIVAAKFAWMNRPAAPIYPKLEFLAFKKLEFIECYSDDEFQTRQFAITGREKEILKLKRKGMTQAQAEEEVDRREAKSNIIEDMAKQKQEAEWFGLAEKRKADILEKQNRELINQHGKELQEKMKRGEDILNRGSYAPKTDKKFKRDKDGYIILDGAK